MSFPEILPLAGEEFGVAAARLSGFAAVVLGWGPDVFWGSTPAELAAVAAALTENGVGDQPRPLDGAAVAALREAFPDG